MAILFMILLFFTALFLIVLVLIQRGKGGGLAGAFGGMGGQSAFGTKAGDMFTRITIGVAAFWIVLCVLSVRLLSTPNQGGLNLGAGNTAVEQKEGAQGQGAEPASPAGGDTNGGDVPAPKGD
jgi:preprotein translocase subunit SecG